MHRMFGIAREITILCLVAIVVHVLITRIRNADKPSPQARLTVGSAITVDGYDFGSAARTLVIATSQLCRFSRENREFHERLVKRAVENNIPVLILAPEISESTVYTRSLEGIGAHVLQCNLGRAGLSGTPTILFVDRLSHLSGIWQGRLGSMSQEVVFARVGSDHHIVTGVHGEIISQVEDQDLSTYTAQALLLDVRDRANFSRNHRSHAKNIPVDELIVRAPLELPHDKLIVIDCMSALAGDCQMAKETLAYMKYSQFRLLDQGVNEKFCQIMPVQ
jgi:rhodanese-related sulfurtransferase